MEKNIYDRLRYVQQNLHAPKGQRNNFGNYNYRSCEDILEASKIALESMEAVILLSDEIVMVGERIYVKATAWFITNKDDGYGQPISVTAFARESLTKKGMDDSQITGATSSYARKYALNGLLLIDDNKDADTGVVHGKGDEINYESNSGMVGNGKPSSLTKPKPAPAPAPAVKPAPTATSEVLITETCRQAVIAAFDGIGVEIWDLEKLHGKPETWTKANHKAMLVAYTTIKDASVNYTVKDYLEGK